VARGVNTHHVDLVSKQLLLGRIELGRLGAAAAAAAAALAEGLRIWREE
jgi:hypothetical protein